MSKPLETPSHPARFDVKDGALIVGVVSLIGGIAHFSIALAAIVFGAMCICVALIPTPRQIKPGKPERSN